MLAPLRRHLRRIRYYSASPQRTAWHRALDTALFTTFFLGFVAAIVCDSLIDRQITVAVYEGQLSRDDTGRLLVRLIDPDQRARWGGGSPVGEFDMHVRDRAAGWPLTAWTRTERPHFDLHIFARGTIESGDLASLDAAGIQPDVTESIAQHLREMPQRYDLREAGSARWLWPRWLVNAGMWWVMLYVLCVLMMVPARIGWHVLQQRRIMRAEEMRRRGLCPSCGYDVRGLEFHDRCPECGKLMT